MSTSLRAHFIGLIFVWALAALFAAPASADPAVNAVGLQGYDPVSYFEGGEPAKGTWIWFATYKGVIYRFASQEHEQMFREDPEKYLPGFGGFCAYGMSQNRKLPTDPEAWRIHDGKLYVFLNANFRDRWLQDPEGNLMKGAANWVNLKGAVIRPLEVAAAIEESQN